MIEVTTMLDYFAAFYPNGVKEIKERFSEGDVHRMEVRGLPPLNLPEDDGWVSVWKPFPFDTVMHMVSGRVSDVLLRMNDESEGFQILEPEDGVETCLKKLSEAKEVFYNTEYEVKNDRRWETHEYEEEAYELYDVLTFLTEDRKKCYRGDYLVPSVSQIRLSLAIYPRSANPSPDSLSLFYESIFHPRKSGDALETVNASTTKEEALRVGEIVFYYSRNRGMPICFASDDGKDFNVYVKGIPCPGYLFQPWVDAIEKSDENEEEEEEDKGYHYTRRNYSETPMLLDFSAVASRTGRFDSFSSSYETNRFSNVVSALCHLEIFGHFIHEEDVAVLKEINGHSAYEHERISSIIKRRPKGGCCKYRNDGHRAVAGIDCPHSALVWRIDSGCMLRGSRFGERLYLPVPPDNENENDAILIQRRNKSLYAAFSYAYLSQTLTYSVHKRSSLRYAGTPPGSKGDYEWYLTVEGILYYRKKENIKQRQEEENKTDKYHEKDSETVGEDEGRERKRMKLNEKRMSAKNRAGVPFFMDPDSASYVEAVSASDARRRLGSIKDPKSGLFELLPILPKAAVTRYGKPISSTNGEKVSIAEASRYDSHAWRKYDGLGKFPTLCTWKEVKKISSSSSSSNGSRNVLYDSKRSDENDLFLLNYICEGRGKEEEEGDKAIGRREELASRLVFSRDLSKLYFSIVSHEEKMNARGREKMGTSFIIDSTRRSGTVDSFCREMEKIMLRKDLDILELGRGSRTEDDLAFENPLWFQCYAYLMTERMGLSTICRTFENVPRSLDEFCFTLHYEGSGRRDHTIVLSFVNGWCEFDYALFWVELDLTEYEGTASKVDVWRIRYDKKKMSTVSSDGESAFGVRFERITLDSFDALLNRAVLFLINDEL